MKISKWRRIGARVLAAMVAASAVGAVSAAPAIAAPAVACPDASVGPGCPAPSGDAEFGFLDTSGAQPLAAGATVSAAQLQGYGVDLAVVDSYANGAQPTFGAGSKSTAADPIAEEDASTTAVGVSFAGGTATQTAGSSGPMTSGPAGTAQAALSSSVNDILWHWGDKSNRMIIYRRGYYSPPNSGWGDAKIQGKHNMNYKTAWATTRYPQPGYPVGAGGSSLEYRTPVYHVKCSGWWIFRTCRIVETVTSRAVVDFRKLSDGWAFGVVTNYAIGYVRAPDWVKNAINI
jgi:hypothetical protein